MSRERVVVRLRSNAALVICLAVVAILADPAAAATPTVVISPATGTPGSGLTITGANWHAGDTILVQIGSTQFGNDVACSLPVHANGTISGDSASNSCQVPNAPAGSQAVTAIDEQTTTTTAHGANFTIIPVLVLTPANAAAGAAASQGTAVAISGHGFAPGNTVSSFKFDGVALTTTPTSMSTDANGNLTGSVSFTVPATATAASHTVSATDGHPNTGTAALTIFHTTLTTTPATGTPGSGLTVSGGGYPPGNHILIQIGTTAFGNDIACTLPVHANGTIAGDSSDHSCQVPSAPVGSQPVVGIDEENQGVVGRTTNFTVKPTLVLTPAGGATGAPTSQGTIVTVGGHGFAPSSTVSTFTFDGTVVSTTPSTISTDANGNFNGTVTFTVPAGATAANHTVSATDAGANSGSATQRVFRVTVVVSPSTGTPGTGLSVSGSGWPAGDHVFVQIGSTAFANNVACTLTANASGAISGDAFTGSCQIPNAPAGSQPLVAIDGSNAAIVARGTNVTVKPVLVLQPAGAAAGAPASPGTTVTINGHGFAPGTSVSTFKFDTTALTTTPSSITTDTNGNFNGTVTFSVPASATAGSHTVSGKDLAANTGSSPQAIFRPTVLISPTTGTPGSPLTVSGSGWPAGDRIFVQIGSTAFANDVACTISADASGAISGDIGTDSCQIPNAPAGSEPLVALDSSNLGIVAHGANATVKPVPVLTPSGTSPGAPASPGATISLTGHGFVANGAVSTFKFDTTVLVTTPPSVATNLNGDTNGPVTFTVPAAAAAGNHTVSASDGANTGTATLKLFRPTVVLSPTSGAVGAPLTVSGSGWPAGDQVFIQIGSTSFANDIACTLKANLAGTISGDHGTNNCSVPSVPTGSEPVIAIDSSAPAVFARGASFTVS